MSRQRSQCIIKKKSEILDENILEEIITEVNEKTNDKAGRRLSMKNKNDVFSLSIKKPAFSDCKKEYPSGTSKVRKCKKFN
jgi:hypothetical protein